MTDWILVDASVPHVWADVLHTRFFTAALCCRHFVVPLPQSTKVRDPALTASTFFLVFIKSSANTISVHFVQKVNKPDVVQLNKVNFSPIMFQSNPICHGTFFNPLHSNSVHFHLISCLFLEKTAYLRNPAACPERPTGKTGKENLPGSRKSSPATLDWFGRREDSSTSPKWHHHHHPPPLVTGHVS